MITTAKRISTEINEKKNFLKSYCARTICSKLMLSKRDESKRYELTVNPYRFCERERRSRKSVEIWNQKVITNHNNNTKVVSSSFSFVKNKYILRKHCIIITIITYMCTSRYLKICE